MDRPPPTFHAVPADPEPEIRSYASIVHRCCSRQVPDFCRSRTQRPSHTISNCHRSHSSIRTTLRPLETMIISAPTTGTLCLLPYPIDGRRPPPYAYGHYSNHRTLFALPRWLEGCVCVSLHQNRFNRFVSCDYCTNIHTIYFSVLCVCAYV